MAHRPYAAGAMWVMRFELSSSYRGIRTGTSGVGGGSWGRGGGMGKEFSQSRLEGRWGGRKGSVHQTRDIKQ